MRRERWTAKLLSLVLTVIMAVSIMPIQADAASVTTVSVGASGCDFKNISDALAKYSSNVVINVKAGTYYEQIRITGSNVTINCEAGVRLSGEKINIYTSNGNYYDANKQDSNGRDVTCNAEMVRIKGNNVIIRGMEIANFHSSSNKIDPAGIRINGNASHVTIDSCKVHDISCTNSRGYNAHGITVLGHGSDELSDITVTGCEVYNLTLGSSESVVFNGNITGIECSNNYIHDCNNIGIDFAGYYQETGSNSDRVHDVECFGNVVVNCTSVTNAAYGYAAGCDGIYVDGGYDVNIHDNFVKGCDIGIEVASEHEGLSSDSVQVQNNIVAESKLYGISIGGCKIGENGYAFGCKIHNNTVYATGDTKCFNVQMASDSSNVITNNLFISSNENYVSYGSHYDNSGNTIKNNVNVNDASVSLDATNRTITVNTSVVVGSNCASKTIIPGQDTSNQQPQESYVPTAQQPYATITVDQHKSDWDNIPTAASEFTQYVRGAKIEYVKVCYDDTYDYLMFNASSFGSGYQIYIDADNNTDTGFDGYDYLIENDRLYVNNGSGWSWQRLTPAESDFTLSRRDSSRHFVEVRFNRAAMNMTTAYSYDVVLLDASFNVTYEASGSVN